VVQGEQKVQGLQGNAGGDSPEMQEVMPSLRREGSQELNGSHLIPFTCRFSQETSADEYYIHTCILYTYILHTRARAHTHTHTYTYTYILAGQARGGERMCRGELCILEVIGFYSLDGKSKPSGRR
jgi:hypothetical protein